MRNFSFFIAPHFLIKYYLFKDIQNIVKQFAFSGILLDVGCGEKPYKTFFHKIKTYIGIDFKHYSKNKEYFGEKPDIYFPKSYIENLKLPFKDNNFDHCLSFQVLEHHRNPEKLISEMVRVSKPKGYILITAPFMWRLHEEPNDYYRFTKYAFIDLFKKNNCKILKIKEQGYFFSTIITLIIEGLIAFANLNRITYVVGILIYPLFLILSYLGLILDKIIPSHAIFLNYLVLAEKSS